jgi:uncharacterized protein YdaU (DUF1376 family)
MSTSSPTKDAPAFDFYAERWTHGTRHMTKVERCDYLDLLVFQWTEQAIPADLDAVARILGYRKASQIPSTVLEKFPIGEDGRRRNARMEVIRSEQRERIRKKSEQRKAAANVRWDRERDRAGEDAGAMRPQDARMCDTHATALRPHDAPIGDTDATALRTQCPPPTTHHPPQIERESRGRPTLAQARSAAGACGVTEQEAEDWWHAREASDWMKGTGGGGTTPVGSNWQADLKTYTNTMREKKARDATRAARHSGSDSNSCSTPAPPRTDTVWSLTESIKSINESLTEIDASVTGVWGELSPAKKEQRRKLVERRKELRRKLSGLEGTG